MKPSLVICEVCDRVGSGLEYEDMFPGPKDPDIYTVCLECFCSTQHGHIHWRSHELRSVSKKGS